MRNLANNTWFLVAIGAITVINLGSLFAFWQLSASQNTEPFMPRGQRVQNPSCIMAERVGFNEEQSVRYNQLRQAHRQEMRSQRNDLSQLKKVLVRESLEDEVNEEKVEVLIQDLGQGHMRRYRNQVHYFNQVKGVCTPKQRAEYRKFMLDVADRVERRGVCRQQNRRDGIGAGMGRGARWQ